MAETTHAWEESSVNQKRLGKASPENVGGGSSNWRNRAATGRTSQAVLTLWREAFSGSIGHFRERFYRRRLTGR
jgi:hypothetical protein